MKTSEFIQYLKGYIEHHGDGELVMPIFDGPGDGGLYAPSIDKTTLTTETGASTEFHSLGYGTKSWLNRSLGRAELLALTNEERDQNYDWIQKNKEHEKSLNESIKEKMKALKV
jgi:hypothetical protein